MVARVKRRLQRIAHQSWFASLVQGLERWEREPRNLLRVLTYHRVDEPSANPHLYQGVVSATPEQFTHQVEQLRVRFTFVGIAEILEAMSGRTSLPPRALLMTFDDAYRDFREHAWPVLRRNGAPVVLFVPTAYPSDRSRLFWWDRLAGLLHAWPSHQLLESPIGRWRLESEADKNLAFRSLRDHVKSLPDAAAMKCLDDLCVQSELRITDNHVLTWDELRELAAEGVTLGAHTRSHPLLHRVPLDQARRECTTSRADLRREIGQAPAIFAYPSGGLNDAVVRMLREEGFQLAFTTRRGINHLTTCDPLRIRRINVGLATPMSLLQAQLSSTARWWNACWR